MVENLEIQNFQNNFRKCHTTLRVFPKRDSLTPSESLDAGLCTRTLTIRADPIFREISSSPIFSYLWDLPKPFR